MTHSYHFKLNPDEHDNLLDLMDKCCINDKSEAITFFISFGFKHIKFILDSLFNENSKKPKRNTRIKDLRVNLKIKDYRLFKSYHSHYNTFSIAMIVRGFITMFIKGLNDFGTLESFLKFLYRSEKVLRNQSFKKEFREIHIAEIFIICSLIIIKFIELLKIHLNC